ncbi:Rhodanese-related sulfurtransferase [Desulfacinum hydrothermale DSM 13146]|uniref:Rhodanese-related sulfurtransferase n=1 Tax=Desulfacinum hydrothermale DSM 13146 TaxID=1121390 RepID=A0A1W1XG90_9BACT|nr:rhodanese-like domain-containing protein [Desulfacinum hydrothermale]SMC22804.1 Rhodanese-related sulfurtransferase [Desulfacinum hydrothermale DSM 13146]
MTEQRKASKVRSLFIDDLNDYQQSHAEKDYVLIDVREPAEYEAGHIPGAVLLPLSTLEGRVHALDPRKELLFYCASGRRSQAATLLAEDAIPDAKALINLLGGYYAWEGKELVDFPRLTIFHHTDDPRQVLHQAMDLEKGAWLFYSHAQELLKDSPMGETARALVDLERTHAQVLYRLLARHYPEDPLPPFQELFQSLEGSIMEGGTPWPEALGRLQGSAPDDCVPFGELALEIEYASYDLYRNAAVVTVGEPVREIFFDLSAQEKGHVRVIAKTFSKCFPEAHG